MKRISSIVLIMLVAFSCVNAQEKSKKHKGMSATEEKERVSKHSTVSNGLMSVTYGQPSKKGRVIFAPDGLAPFGKVWRTGADEATEVTFKKDCIFGDKRIKAGTYSLFTVPYAGEWMVVLNSELGQWGAFGYDKVKNKNVVEIYVPIEALNAEVETFTIATEPAGLRMSWDKTSVFVPVKVIQ